MSVGGEEKAGGVLQAYYNTHDIFHSLAKIFYPVVATHADAVLEQSPIRANALIHIYTFSYTMPLLAWICFVPSYPYWIVQAYRHELRGRSIKFLIFAVITGILFIALMVFVIDIQRNADLINNHYRRGYNVIEDNRFLIKMAIIHPVLLGGVTYLLSGICGYMILFFEKITGKKILG